MCDLRGGAGAGGVCEQEETKTDDSTNPAEDAIQTEAAEAEAEHEDIGCPENQHENGPAR